MIRTPRAIPEGKRSAGRRPTDAQIRIGTSGWHYESWRGRFFPAGVRLGDQLQYFATQFSTVELNGVFYRTPAIETIKRWRDQTGDNFVFSWKASKFITHWKRLRDTSASSLELLYERASHLRGKVGPILFQLPPDFKVDEERLKQFLKLLSRQHRYVLEFRHPSWYRPSILRLLSDQNIALCISDHADAPAPWERTADFIYVRGHGPGGLYKGHYTSHQLKNWAGGLNAWRHRGFDAYVYFDNDQKAAAPADALKLQHLLASRSMKTTSSRKRAAANTAVVVLV